MTYRTIGKQYFSQQDLYNKNIVVFLVIYSINLRILLANPFFFFERFKTIVIRFKRNGYNVDVIRQTAGLVINPIAVDGLRNMRKSMAAILYFCTSRNNT